jgi:hypothetical protein
MSVLETDKYRAEVELQFVLHGESGETLWEGTFAGAASRFGRSLKAENYSEAISDALKQAIARLFSDSSFREMLLNSNASRSPRREQATTPDTLLRSPISSGELKAELIKLLNVGVGEDLLLEYVRTMPLREPLTADEIIEWRNAKIPDPVVRAALSSKSERSSAPAIRPSPVPTPTSRPRTAKDDL